MHFARTLLNSVMEHTENADFYVGLCDQAGDFDFSNDNFNVIEISDLDNIPDLNKFIFRYTILELNTAIKPYVIEQLFQMGYEKVIYFDPDIKIYGGLAQMLSLLDDNEVLLTPHLTDLLDDGKLPTELDILRSGTYNLGYVGLRQTENTRKLVKWWQSKLYEHCVVDMEKGLFVDQKWMDLVPGMFSNVFVNRNPAWNIAYWNLNHRSLSEKDGTFFVDGNALTFFHFSGFSPDNKVLSKHQNRFTKKGAGKCVAKLCDNYSADLLANGYKECASYPYAFGVFPDGTPVPDIARYVYRDEFDWKKDEMDVSSIDGAKQFKAFLNEPVVIDGKSLPYITRLARHLYTRRPDLIAAFPDLTGEDGLRFAHWYVEHVTEQLRFAECFVDPVRYALGFEAGGGSITGSTGPHQVAKSPLYSSLYRLAHRSRSLARPFVSPRVRQKVKALLLKKALRTSLAPQPNNELETVPRKDFAEYDFGVNLYGYVHAESGVGQAARANIEALSMAGVPVSVLDFRHGNSSRMKANVDESLKGDATYQFNLFHINADQTLPALDVLGHQVLQGHYNIGYWAWELPEFPDEWVAASEYLDEIWTLSTFCKEAIEKKVAIPVRVVPLSIWCDATPSDTPQFAFDGFTFLTMFDCLSVPERKNVFAVIDAFEGAFAPNSEEAQLVVKVSNLDADNDFSRRLHAAVKKNADIKLISSYLGRNEVVSLVSKVDCFVSLHRSEGFGLGITEAMLYKTPVIVTGWSGNMEFCNDENSLLVDYDLVKLKETYGPYRAGQTWAEPNVQHASKLMRQVFENEDIRTRLVDNAHSSVLLKLSPKIIGQSLKEHLTSISSEKTENSQVVPMNKAN